MTLRKYSESYWEFFQNTVVAHISWKSL